MKRFSDRWVMAVTVVLVWAVVYLPCLGRAELRNEEGRRVLPAVTMLETGNWVQPYIGGEPYHGKPPLINWLIAGAFRLTGGESEWAARLPSVLWLLAFALLCVLGAGTRTERPQLSDSYPPPQTGPSIDNAHHDTAAGNGGWLPLWGRFLAALIFLTSTGMFEKGRTIEIEAVYIAQTGMALLWWLDRWGRWRLAGESERRWLWKAWIGAGVLLGLGLMTKGPLHILVFYAVVVSILCYARQWPALWHPAHWLGILVMVAPFAIWYHLAAAETSSEAISGQMTGQMLIRLLPGNWEPLEWLFCPVRAILNFSPWMLFLPLLWMKRFTCKIPERWIAEYKGMRLGMVISFVLIYLMPSSAARYSMPLFPVAALLLGWVLARHPAFEASDRLWRTVLLIVAIGTIGSAIVGIIVADHGLWGWWSLAVSAVVGAVVWRYRGRLADRRWLAVVTAGVMMVVGGQYAVFGSAIMVQDENNRPVGEQVASIVPPGETVYLYRPWYQKFSYYIRRPRGYLLQPQQLTSPSVRYVMINGWEYQNIAEAPCFLARSPRLLHEFPETKGVFRLLSLAPLEPVSPAQPNHAD